MLNYTREPTAYRGYLYVPRLPGVGGDITRDGHNIAYARSLAHAVREIDALLDGAPVPRGWASTEEAGR
jgi:hypothetical protein